MDALERDFRHGLLEREGLRRGSRFPALTFREALDHTTASSPPTSRGSCTSCAGARRPTCRAIAYGDSQSDGPLVELAGASVAVKPTPT